MAQITGAEYWARKGNVKLYVYRKRAADAARGEPVLFLVHGSSASGRSSFDLGVPGRSYYSLMDHFAAWATMCGPSITKAMAARTAPTAIPISRPARRTAALLNELVAKIGENISVRRFVRFQVGG